MLRVALVCCALIVVSTGCNGGEPPPDAGPCSFEAVQTVFDHNCTTGGTTCHGSMGSGGGIQLDRPHSYRDIVGVASSYLPTMNIIQPGSSANSFLYHKVLGDMYTLPGCDMSSMSCGVQMPMIIGVTLTPPEIETIRCWIASGAPNAGQVGTVDGGH